MKNSIASFLLIALLAAAFVASPLSLADSPDGSFDPSQEECGFLMGTSVERVAAAYSAGSVDFDSIANPRQACVNELGYFYKSEAHPESWGEHSQWGKMDFAWSTNPNNNVRLGDFSEDGAHRFLKGRAELTDLEASDLGGAPVLDNKVQFDWSCEGKPWCSDEALAQRVKVNLSTGELSGVAWNVHTGYIDFTGTTLELAPREIQAFVDVFANDGTDLIPGGVDLLNAPLADGYAFYRARVQFYDTLEGRYLNQDEVLSAKISVRLTPGSQVYIDQVANKGDAVLTSSENDFYAACGNTPQDGACVLDEGDGTSSWNSWNSFVFSLAPTSNMLGVPDDSARNVKYPVDRDGGESWYPEQAWLPGAAWHGDANDVRERCSEAEGGVCSAEGDREDFFYKRSVDRNRIEIASITVSDLEFSSAYLPEDVDYLLNWGEEREVNAEDFAYEPPENQKRLSFRPQFRLTTLGSTGSLTLPGANPVRVTHNGEVSVFSPQKRQAAPSELLSRTYRLYSHAYSKLNPAGAGTYSDEYLLFEGASTQDNEDWVQHRWDAEAASCPDSNPFPEISGPTQRDGVHEDALNGAPQCVMFDGGGLSCPGGTVPADDGFGCVTPPPLGYTWLPLAYLPPLPGPDNPADRLQPGDPGYQRPEAPKIDLDIFPVHCAQAWNSCEGVSPNYEDAYCLDSQAEYNDWYDYWYCEDTFEPKTVLPVRMEERVVADAGGQTVGAFLFDMTYTQAVTVPGAPAKRATAPSVEFYVCDELTAALKTRFATTLGDACYYTAYLSVADPYADRVDLKLKGAVSAVMNGQDLLENNENLSQLGVPTNDLRNRLYAQLRRYVLGESGTDFDMSDVVLRRGTLDQDMHPKEAERNGGIASLLGGRLLYAQGANGQNGDVTIQGSDSFLDTTLVVFDGNVYIDGDITGGRLQLFVFGGNVYIHPDVKNLHVNLFTDQAVLSDHVKTGNYDEMGVPVRTLQEREEALKNQLYINGTLVSLLNTLDDSAGVELNINALREFRYCNQINPLTGAIDTLSEPEPCDIAQLSDYREGPEEAPVPVQNAVIVEHHAPSSRQLSLDLF